MSSHPKTFSPLSATLGPQAVYILTFGHLTTHPKRRDPSNDIDLGSQDAYLWHSKFCYH